MFKFCLKLKLLGSIVNFWHNFWPDRCIRGPIGGVQNLPNFRFSVFKRKLQVIQLQKLILICWYGYCGYGEVGCDPKWVGGPPGGSSMLKKLRNSHILFQT